MKSLLRLLAVLLAFTLIAAACGDDDEGTTADDSAEESADDSAEEPADDSAEEPADDSAEEPADDSAEEPVDDETAAGIARAQAVVDSVSTPPDAISPTVALTAVPEPGQTVAWLSCEVTCGAFDSAFEEATAALGWNLEVISVSSFDPGAAFLQALDLGADHIAITGTPPALVADQFEAAQDAGVGIYMCYDTTVPDPENNNLYMQCSNEESVFRAGSVLANKIIVESGGDANVLMVNIPDFAVLVSEREGAQAAYDENCPGCTFSELPVTLDQLLAGDVPGAIVSALQADPEIDWIHIAFDGMSGGILDTLEEADLLEGVKVAGVDLDPGILPDIVSERYEFWTTNPVAYASWLMVDGMARTSVGMDIPQDDRAVLPTFIVDTPAQAEELIATEGEWPGPTNYQDQFKALWGVG